MVVRTQYVVKVIVTPLDSAFGAPVASAPIALSDGKTLDVLITYGAGDAAELNASFTAQNGAEGLPQAIGFWLKAPGSADFILQPKEGAQVPIGGTGSEERAAILRVTADMLASIDADRVIFHTAAVVGTNVPGAITALLFEPRYFY